MNHKGGLRLLWGNRNQVNQMGYSFINFLIFLTVFWMLSGGALASESLGVIEQPNSFAWGDVLGWINFAPALAGVVISDTNVVGKIWSNSYGWINLGPLASGGVGNTCSGELSGRAWSESLGWINFAGAYIDETGFLRGMTNPSVSSGRINFECEDCSVRTDWRPCSSRQTPLGGGSSASAGVPFTPLVLTGDISADGAVDIFDFNLLMIDWGTVNKRSDINSDGAVDIFDFNLLMVGWK